MSNHLVKNRDEDPIKKALDNWTLNTDKIASYIIENEEKLKPEEISENLINQYGQKEVGQSFGALYLWCKKYYEEYKQYFKIDSETEKQLKSVVEDDIGENPAFMILALLTMNRLCEEALNQMRQRCPMSVSQSPLIMAAEIKKK